MKTRKYRCSFIPRKGKNAIIVKTTENWDDPVGWDGEGGGRGGSGWGTHVHLWQIHVNVWQNHYNIVK